MSSTQTVSTSAGDTTKKRQQVHKSSTKQDDKRNLKQDDSTDSDYIPGDSDEYDTEQEEMDKLEYRKFIAELFPSQHAEKTVELQDKIKKRIQKSGQALEIEEETATASVAESDKETCCESDEDHEYNSDDSDYDDDESEHEEDITSLFNILFTIKDNRVESESESEESDMDSSSDTEIVEDVTVTQKKTKPSTSAKKPAKDADTDAVKTRSKHKHEKQAKNGKSKAKTDATTKPMHTKKTSSRQSKTDAMAKPSTSSGTTDYVDPTSIAFKEMLDMFKKKNQGAAPELFKKLDSLIEEEDKKMRVKQIKEKKKLIKENCNKFRNMLYEKSKQNEMRFFRSRSVDKQKFLLEKMMLINSVTKISKPYKITLIESDIPTQYKAAAMKKINSLKYMDQGSGEYYKIKQWVDTFMKIPFGTYANLPINIKDGIDKCDAFMQNAREVLNNAVYGLDDAKLQILQMMAQWISNPSAVGSAIAIKGPMGTGKTTLVKEGISKILNRPFAFIALGGATDSSFLEGHSYTYEGSVWGKIVDIIIASKCMNPVIYFDELDKVSDTPKGEEIIGILTHLTDTTQNSQFHDKYFSGIDFDLSKCLFIFSYNDEHKVNPILRDRMYRIQTQGYNGKEKGTISRNYLMPSIEKNVSFNKDEIIITDKAIQFMIKDYTDKEKGVRNLKRCLEIIYTKLNLFRLMKPKTKLFSNVETFEVVFPFTVTEEIVKQLLVKNESEDMRYMSMYS